MCISQSESEKQVAHSCFKRNLVYETWCKPCEEEAAKRVRGTGVDPEKLSFPLYKYIGETARSAFERGAEHWDDVVNLSKGSHMLKHALSVHENEPLENIRFGMRVLKFHKSAVNSQIYEGDLDPVLLTSTKTTSEG